MRQIHCPVLVFHGDADRLVPTAMGREVAAAAAGPVELVLIHGAGHNETYDVGGRAYRGKIWGVVAGKGGRGRGRVPPLTLYLPFPPLPPPSAPFPPFPPLSLPFPPFTSLSPP